MSSMKRILNHWTLLALIAVLSIGVFASMNVKNAFAQATTFAVEYQYNWPPTGPNFKVNVTVSEAYYLYSWQVRMKWDPAVLSFAGIMFGGFLTTQPEGSTPFMAPPGADYILFSEATNGQHPGKSAAKGLLATITFTVLAPGHTIIDIYGDAGLPNPVTRYVECFQYPQLVTKYPIIQHGYMCTVAGDTNFDGDVDYDDFIVLAGAYGTVVGQPSFKANADFDHQNDVDYDDFIKLAGNYGKIV